MKLDGKAIIIIGGTAGIGAASARLFAHEGAKLTIAGRGDAGEAVAQTMRDDGGSVFFARADVSKPADIHALFDAHLERHGRLDVLFNNAAYEGPWTSFVDTSQIEMERVWATNVTGLFVACQLAARIMIAAKGGSIINTTSGMAREGQALPGASAYTASKGAVIALTRALAAELSPLGVRVNSLNPGVIDTATFRRSVSAAQNPGAFLTALTQKTLLKRIGTPEEMARAALFLASDDGSYVTGIDMLVDGGLTLG